MEQRPGGWEAEAARLEKERAKHSKGHRSKVRAGCGGCAAVHAALAWHMLTICSRHGARRAIMATPAMQVL